MGICYGGTFRTYICFREPAGIRPAYYYQDDESVVVSEETIIQTVLMSLLKVSAGPFEGII
jgi:asparagine synthetase B (glutamine-hydrolysing)